MATTRMQALADQLAALRTPGMHTAAAPPQADLDEPSQELPSLHQRLMRMQASEVRRVHDRTVAQEASHRVIEERSQQRLTRERALRDARHAEQATAFELVDERAARQDAEARLMRQIDERCFAVQRLVAREKREREDAEERMGGELSEGLAALAEAIDEERTISHRRLEELAARHAAEARALRDEIVAEREQRERFTQEFVSMLESLSTSVRHDLDLEKQDREVSKPSASPTPPIPYSELITTPLTLLQVTEKMVRRLVEEAIGSARSSAAKEGTT